MPFAFFQLAKEIDPIDYGRICVDHQGFQAVSYVKNRMVAEPIAMPVSVEAK
jgi:hypothetical protein